MFLFQLTDPSGFSSSAPSFTSHYVSILILKAAGGGLTLTSFTFHYISILILPEISLQIPVQHLHSIMFLF